MFKFLIQCRKPHPGGRGQMGLAVKPLTAISCLELLPQRPGGGECSEQISKVLTHDMALQYHIVWVPKYGYRVLVGPIKEAACTGIQAICGYAGCKIMELNVQKDHVY